MASEIFKRLWNGAKVELTRYQSQYAIGALILWGVLILLFSINLSKAWLAFIYLIFTHIVVVAAAYAGFTKGVGGKKSPTALAIALIILLLTVLIDALFVIQL
ncbi:MAG: hypothetical protein PHV43_01190 [Candidatus Colwellbacteria bacterium]|nr:hypothetical protein [Candidatus Colwellbacteria bacterium]